MGIGGRNRAFVSMLSIVPLREQKEQEVVGGGVDGVLCPERLMHLLPIAGAGAGTITGISCTLKEHNPKCVMVGIDPMSHSGTLLAFKLLTLATERNHPCLPLCIGQQWMTRFPKSLGGFDTSRS